jgi:outer membrane lipoprotein LolB
VTARLCRFGSLLLLAALLCACAQPQLLRTPGTQSGQAYWSGRLSLRTPTDPPQSLASQFELAGNAQAGTLLLTSPLGNTLAKLQWTPQSASLQRAGEFSHFATLSALTQALTGTEVPIEALFAWLRGDAVDTPGWSADLSQIRQGRLLARQLPPAVGAELRVIFEP